MSESSLCIDSDICHSLTERTKAVCYDQKAPCRIFPSSIYTGLEVILIMHLRGDTGDLIIRGHPGLLIDSSLHAGILKWPLHGDLIY